MVVAIQRVWNVLFDHGTFCTIGERLKEISLRRKKRRAKGLSEI